MAQEVKPDPVEPIKSEGELCWNCRNQHKENYLKKGICEECGFNKNELYNGQLEADKAAQRVEAARAKEQAQLAAAIRS